MQGINITRINSEPKSVPLSPNTIDSESDGVQRVCLCCCCKDNEQRKETENLPGAFNGLQEQVITNTTLIKFLTGYLPVYIHRIVIRT